MAFLSFLLSNGLIRHSAHRTEGEDRLLNKEVSVCLHHILYFLGWNERLLQFSFFEFSKNLFPRAPRKILKIILSR